MAGLIFIIPILAFDIWLAVTTGRRQVRRWLESNKTRPLFLAAIIGLALAIWLTFFLQFNYHANLRVAGFPVPLKFFHPGDKGAWTETELPPGLPLFGMVTDILTGLVAPFIPYKIGEFLKKVKAELK